MPNPPAPLYEFARSLAVPSTVPFGIQRVIFDLGSEHGLGNLDGFFEDDRQTDTSYSDLPDLVPTSATVTSSRSFPMDPIQDVNRGRRDDDPDASALAIPIECADIDENSRYERIASWIDDVQASLQSGVGEDEGGQTACPQFTDKWDFLAQAFTSVSVISKVWAGELVRLFDSGATHRISPYRDGFSTFESMGPQFFAVRIGDITTCLLKDGKPVPIQLKSIFHRPALGFTIFSVGQIDDAEFFAVVGDGKWVISNIVVGVIPKDAGPHPMLWQTEFER